MSADVVCLEGWHGWQVHCPFCGKPDDENSFCKHVLYVIGLGNFHYRSDRFCEAAGLPKDDGDPSLPWNAINSRGGARELASAVDLPNHVQFALNAVNDITYIGFACLEEELMVWGRKAQDPKS